jgi:signal transduction histidine kinase
MPVSRIAFVRTTVLFILLGLAALLAIVGMTLWLVWQTQAYSDRVTGARQQRAAVIDLRGLAQDAETGQRGYLLTSNRDYLEPYINAAEKLPGQLERVRTLMAADPEAKHLVERLTTVLSDKMAELKNTIDLHNSGRDDEALVVVKTNHGRALMDEARGIFERLIDVAESKVTDSLEQQRQNISYLRWVTLVSALAIMLIVGGSVWTVLRYTRQLVDAELEVSTLNVGLEERVSERTADLGRANEEIQRFAYIVTHDLRAPLVNIMGFTSELETGLAAVEAYIVNATEDSDQTPVVKDARIAVSEDMPEAIGFIRSSTAKMDGLINAILRLSREGRRALKPEKIDLDELLRAASANIQHQTVEAGGEIEIKAHVPALYSDRLALEQVFGNLLDNAVKYRHADRALSIGVRARMERGRRVLIDVEDNGRGIADQDHERIFDLFRRSGPQDQRGEGIGLAHVRVIVRNLGGEITVKSKLGQGTTFTISLPLELIVAAGAA